MLDMLDNFAVANKNINLTNSALIRKYDLIEKVPVKDEHDYTDAPNIVYLSEYKHAAIQYIAGYVAKSVTKQILCIKCKKALFDKEKKSSDFVNNKDKGGLRHAFKSMIKICSEREKCFQRMLITTSQKLPQCKNVQEGIAVAVLRTIDVKQVFTNLEDHMLDSIVTENTYFC